MSESLPLSQPLRAANQYYQSFNRQHHGHRRPQRLPHHQVQDQLCVVRLMSLLVLFHRVSVVNTIMCASAMAAIIRKIVESAVYSIIFIGTVRIPRTVNAGQKLIRPSEAPNKHYYTNWTAICNNRWQTISTTMTIKQKWRSWHNKTRSFKNHKLVQYQFYRTQWNPLHFRCMHVTYFANLFQNIHW